MLALTARQAGKQIPYFPPPTLLPPLRLYFLGSFLDIRDLSLVPFPPSQKPVPFLLTSEEWQMLQSEGRYACSREQWPLFEVSMLVGILGIQSRGVKESGGAENRRWTSETRAGDIGEWRHS